MVKWGILGTASIARKVCVAVIEASNADCIAVASRSQDKAEVFAKENGIPKAYGSYDDLLNDPEVEVVYIPLPTGVRKEWIIKAATQKKHILTEKPFATTTRDAVYLVEFCKEKGVQLMDNTMFMHHERQVKMRSYMDDADMFGTVKRVVSSFTIGGEEGLPTDNIRLKRDMEPLGCLGDLGWYNIRFSLWAFNYEDPLSVSCNFLQENSEGVPLDVSGTMKFSNGRSATFDCSFTHSLQQWARVAGTKAVLNVDDFVVPRDQATEFTVERGGIEGKAIYFGNETLKHEKSKCHQHTRVIEKMSEIVSSGELDPFWPKVTLQTQLLMGALVASARKGGAWLTPKLPGLSKKELQPVQLRKPKFMKVSSLRPHSKGLNLEIKVVSAKEVDNGILEAQVGDATASVTFSTKDSGQKKLLQEGASLIVRNGEIHMFKGFIRLQVGKWGKLVVADEAFEFEAKTSHNISGTEYELVTN